VRFFNIFFIAAIGIWSSQVKADFESSKLAYQKNDFVQAYAECKSDAVKGDATCQSSIGYLYEKGLGVKKDATEAMKWYRLAATQGNLVGLRSIAYLYHIGLGVDKDYVEAMKWYRLAADKNDPVAQNSIGILYLSGEGVKKDIAEAVKWYRLAANQGDQFSQANLGDAYASGLGVSKDDAEAVKWYRLAANQGNATAQNRLGWHYQNGLGVEKNFEEALKLYRAAADQGDAKGQSNLGFMYSFGFGVLKDGAESAKWHRLAANQGNAVSQAQLAYAYLNGAGVDKDATEAAKWYRLAENQGNLTARLGLGYLYQTGDGVKKDEIEALKWFILCEKSTSEFESETRSAANKARLDLEGKLSSNDIRIAQQRVESWESAQPTQSLLATDIPKTIVASRESPPDRRNLTSQEVSPEAIQDVAQKQGAPSTKVSATVKPGKTETQALRTPKAFALVIGNSAYPGSELPNPKNDARAIAKQLAGFGFNVELVIDANRKKFVDALGKFADKSVGADLTLIFYAGHGVQYNGVNYLIPTDTNLNTTTSAFTLEAISLTAVLDQYLPTTTRIVLLDACRDNPLSRSLARTRGISTGLAPISVSSGTLISYATKDGSVASDGDSMHSPYTAALLRHLADPVDINIVLRRVRSRVLDATNKKQEPWEYGSLLGDELVLSRMITKQR
jgi:TPR repeat protein